MTYERMVVLQQGEVPEELCLGKDGGTAAGERYQRNCAWGRMVLLQQERGTRGTVPGEGWWYCSRGKVPEELCLGEDGATAAGEKYQRNCAWGRMVVLQQERGTRGTVPGEGWWYCSRGEVPEELCLGEDGATAAGERYQRNCAWGRMVVLQQERGTRGTVPGEGWWYCSRGEVPEELCLGEDGATAAGVRYQRNCAWGRMVVLQQERSTRGTVPGEGWWYCSRGEVPEELCLGKDGGTAAGERYQRNCAGGRMVLLQQERGTRGTVPGEGWWYCSRGEVPEELCLGEDGATAAGERYQRNCAWGRMVVLQQGRSTRGTVPGEGWWYCSRGEVPEELCLGKDGGTAAGERYQRNCAWGRMVVLQQGEVSEVRDTTCTDV